MMFSNLRGEIDTHGRIRRCVIEGGAASPAPEVMVSAFPFVRSQTVSAQKGDKNEHIVR